MSDSIMPVSVPNGDGFGGFGGGMGMLTGLLFGGLLGGGWGGFGYGNRGGFGAGQVGADVAIQGSLDHVSDQVQQGNLMNLQGQNQIQQGIAGAAGLVQNGIYQNSLSNLQGQNQQTVANLQGFAGVGQQICCSTGRLSQEIDRAGDQTVAAINAANIQGMNNTQVLNEKLCQTNQNILQQGYEERLQAQGLASQLQAQHADLSGQIYREGCQTRELQREIQSQAIRDKLAEQQAENAALKAQLNLQSQLQAQTLYLVNRLQPTETAPAATTAAG